MAIRTFQQPAMQPAVSVSENPAVLTRLANTATGGLASVANLLDLPGSMVRDVATLHNPFDQLLSPMSGDNRTSGRDMLRTYGLAGKDDTWGNFGAGLALDIASDPLTYLTLGASAVGKGGKLVKAAGTFDDVARVAAKKAGKAVGEVGKREARLTTTLQDMLTHGDADVQRKIASTIGRQQPKDIAKLMNEPIGGLASFKPTGTVMGTGATAQKIARGLDKVGNSLFFGKIPGTDFAPVARTAALFNAPMREATTPIGYAQNEHLFRQIGEAEQEVRKQTAERANVLQQAKMNADTYDVPLREAMEGVSQPQYPQPVMDMLGQMKQENANMLGRSRAAGLPLAEYVDPEAEYAARYLTAGHQKAPGGAPRAVSTLDPSKTGRLEFLHDIKGGTATTIALAQDKAFNDMIANGASVADLENYIKAAHPKIPEKYVTKAAREKAAKENAKRAKAAKGGPFTPVLPKESKRLPEIASWMAGLSPETRASGIFGNSPVIDHQVRRLNAKKAMLGADKVIETMFEPGVMQPASNAARVEGSAGVADLLKRMGMTDEPIISRVVQSGQFAPDQVMDEVFRLKQQRIPNAIADDMSRFVTKLQAPSGSQPWLDVVDNVSNAFKAGVTSPFPAFHVRNRLSGWVQNLMHGMTDRQSEKAAKLLLKGEVIPGAAAIPAVREEAARRGIAQLDDAMATDIVGELSHAAGVAPKFAGVGATAVGRANDLQGAAIDDVLQAVPGVGRPHFSWKKLARMAIGKEPGTSWKPWDIRGVQGRMESGFAPMAAGQYAGHYAEGLNRIAPFINQIKQGVDVSEAARRVADAQVAYGNKNFTKFETDVMARLFPFYKFSKGIAAPTVKMLSENPGGLMGQTIRTTNRARKPGEQTPDYVAETASIPLNGLPIVGSPPEGTNRYLTGLGLMFEDPLGFVGAGPRGTMLELGSRMNPLVKAPLEWAAGESFFQKGPMGGRDLTEMDPTIGRILANITGQKDAVKFPGSEPIEHVMANTPLARLLTTTRALTDTRKNLATKAINTLTGLRISDVSPAAQDALLRERAQEQMRTMGGKQFVRSYFPKEMLAAMNPDQKAQAAEMQQLITELAAKAKARAAK